MPSKSLHYAVAALLLTLLGSSSGVHAARSADDQPQQPQQQRHLDKRGFTGMMPSPSGMPPPGGGGPGMGGGMRRFFGRFRLPGASGPQGGGLPQQQAHQSLMSRFGFGRRYQSVGGMPVQVDRHGAPVNRQDMLRKRALPPPGTPRGAMATRTKGRGNRGGR